MPWRVDDAGNRRNHGRVTAGGHRCHLYYIPSSIGVFHTYRSIFFMTFLPHCHIPSAMPAARMPPPSCRPLIGLYRLTKYSYHICRASDASSSGRRRAEEGAYRAARCFG